MSRFYSVLIAVFCVAAWGGCAQADRATAIDQVVQDLGKLPVKEPGVQEGERTEPQQEGDYACSTQSFTETRQLDRLVAYSVNSAALWPGAIVAGDSIYDGLFTQVPVERAPMAYSISLANLDGEKSAVLEEPSLSSFRESIGEILESEVTGATPANIYSEIERVHSEEQLALALGAEVDWLSGAVANASASFDFDREDIHSRYVVRYVQSYYTVDVDPPGRPSDIFAPWVGPAQVESRLAGGGPPVYVSSITYGRMILFTFESQYSAKELGAALEFAYSGGADVGGDVSVSYRDILERSEITAYILGGSGADAAKSIDSYEALMDFIQSGGDYSKDSPGAPIAYRLSHLADNSPARLSLTEDYQVEDCRRVSQKVRVALESLRVDKAGGDDELELYGTIQASTADGEAVLFDRDADHYVPVAEGETWPGSDGPISEAVLQVEPKEGEMIWLDANVWDLGVGWLQEDHSVGDVGEAIPFETGWHKEVTLQLTGDGSRVEATFSLTPI